MQRLTTQFDSMTGSVSVATPTCSSCCCCCCCLATTIASSSLLARRVNLETKKKKIISGSTLTALAALFLPVIGLMTYVLAWLINEGFKSCTLETFDGSRYTAPYSYTVCRSPVNGFIPVLAIGSSLIVLFYIYTRAKMAHPISRSFLITLLITVALVIEVFVGAAMILTGIGGIVYLCLVPIIIGVINKWYTRVLLPKV